MGLVTYYECDRCGNKENGLFNMPNGWLIVDSQAYGFISETKLFICDTCRLELYKCLIQPSDDIQESRKLEALTEMRDGFLTAATQQRVDSECE